MSWPPPGPAATVDVIIERVEDGRPSLILIRRANAPLGWALPGGFVDRGEKTEDAAIREVYEETGLVAELVELLGVYSDPSRDPRLHTLSLVYIGRAVGRPHGMDDAAEARLIDLETLTRMIAGQDGPEGLGLAFDHARILGDYLRWRATGQRPRPDPVATLHHE